MSAIYYYLHGFNSSPSSKKAQVTHDWLALHAPSISLRVPRLPFDPLAARQSLLEELTKVKGEHSVGLIGSSLGGYYACLMALDLGLPAALVNPALCPHRLLVNYLGWNVNLYTGERYLFTQAHVDALTASALTRERLQSVREKLFLLTQTGDETLDYREALELLPGTPSWIQAGGDHGFSAFERVLPAIHAFFSQQFSS